MFILNAFQGATELGIIYAIMALGVFISFRTLNMPDLTVDSSFTLGAAAGAMVTLQGHPILGLFVAFFAGTVAGSITALLHTKLKIQALLAGILMMLGLYSINLKVMGNRANINLLNKETVFSYLEGSSLDKFNIMIIGTLVLTLMLIVIYFFLETKFGLVIRATGDNIHMVKALGENTDFAILVGLAVSNGLVALSGALIAQEQLFVDVSMGIGMVVIGLASVIIGEVIFGTKSLLRRLIAVSLGAIIYRLIIAVVLELGMPTTDLKLISAVIVAFALSSTVIKEMMDLHKKKRRRVGVKC